MDGMFEHLSDYKEAAALEENIKAFYKFSGELGTVNYAHSKSIISGDDDNLFKAKFLQKHGIKEHLIILSAREAAKNNTYVQTLSMPADLF